MDEFSKEKESIVSKELIYGENINLLMAWVRLLQTALTIEVDNSFKNVYGRKEHFNTFLSREINSFRSPLLSKEDYEKLMSFVNSFDHYPYKEINAKRRLVVDTRKFLGRLANKYKISTISKPSPLRLSTLRNTLNDNKTYKILNLDSLLADVKGVGPKIQESLASLGLCTVKDLLSYYPRDYVDYSELQRIQSLEAGKTATIIATVRRTSSYTSPRNRNLSIVEFQLEDFTGKVKVTRFFIGRRFSNKAFLKKQESLFPKGTMVAVSGLVKESNYGKTFNDPLIEILEHRNSLIKSQAIGRLVPIYHLTEGLTAERFRNIVRNSISLASTWIDPLPNQIRVSRSLLKKSDAIYEIHLPRDQSSLKEAKRRLVFDEFFFLQLGLLRRRIQLKKNLAPNLDIHQGIDGLVSKFLLALPFDLTNSQKEVLAQIESDLALSKPMSRLLQGDVGSGKTVIAIAALLNAVQSGWQGALMAPTEVLAHQHYLTLCRWLPQFHITLELLTGSTSLKDRRRIYSDLSTGNLKIIVGTHALIEDKVDFYRLGLVVVDEQHRFGVNQRNLLLNKGLYPHLLTMTATPIPRTLALSIHGDLDVSQINELPPGRTPIKTLLVSDAYRDKAYDLIRDELKSGFQAYIVLPLVEESDKLDLRSAIDAYEELSNNVFQDYEIGLLHGRMHSKDKKSIIRRFSNREIKVLVSTTVIEVGVDVPEATVILIEHADRFGLAQLHQLRGRVGRGSNSSQCILIDTAQTESSKKRLEVLVNSNDGFEISETDLRIRGPGQVLGTKQSGLPDFALANLVEDEKILEYARDEARNLLKDDPDLSKHKLLKDMLNDYWNQLVSKTQLN